jgi:hypothetical protein
MILASLTDGRNLFIKTLFGAGEDPGSLGNAEGIFAIANDASSSSEANRKIPLQVQGVQQELLLLVV